MLVTGFFLPAFAQPDPVVVESISKISADSIESTVMKLVGFETRHNLSTRQDPHKGIGQPVNGSTGKHLLTYLLLRED